MSKSIEWEIWHNPVEEMLEDEHIEDEDMSFEDKMDMQNGMVNPNIVNGKNYIMTPLGFLPAPSHNKIQENFNLWIGHTNFHIDKKVQLAIENVPGVEILSVHTPYRFLVGIAKHSSFNDKNVRFAIQKAVCEEPKSLEDKLLEQIESDADELEANFHRLVNKMKKEKHLYWFVFALPNGHIISYKANTEDEKYFKKLHSIKEVNELIHGKLITNEDA